MSKALWKKKWALTFFLSLRNQRNLLGYRENFSLTGSCSCSGAHVTTRVFPGQYCARAHRCYTPPYRSVPVFFVVGFLVCATRQNKQHARTTLWRCSRRRPSKLKSRLGLSPPPPPHICKHKAVRINVKKCWVIFYLPPPPKKKTARSAQFCLVTISKHTFSWSLGTIHLKWCDYTECFKNIVSFLI